LAAVISRPRVSPSGQSAEAPATREYHCGETVESKKDLLTAGEITISIADLFA